MAIEQLGTTTEYKADGLGETKPVLRIGGTTEKFVPNVNLSFQCESGTEKYFINVNRKSVTVGKEIQSLASEKLALTVGNETDIWHINEDGTFEWDIEFAAKPATNVFTWDLLHSSGLEFHYQPALTQDEIDKGRIRPDKVVGSYAVYCDKTDHRKDSKGNTIANYRTGKLMHIYRPLCTDAKGNTTWATLNIADGKLSITIPQKFLDVATYPVTLDPELGYTSVGASTLTDSSYRESHHSTTDASGGDTSTISVYVVDVMAGGPWYMNVGIYNDSSKPNSIMATSVQFAPGGTGWRNANYVATLAASTKYWIAFSFPQADSRINVAYDTVSDGWEYYKQVGTEAALPASWGTGDGTYTSRFSLYATYAAAGGASIPRSNPFSRPFSQSLGRGGF